MSAKFKGLSVSTLSLIGVSIVFALVIQFESFLLAKQTIFGQLLYPLLVVTALFAAQFKHSRITLLCWLWLLFLASLEYPLPWSGWLKANAQWLVLTGCVILLLLSQLKDRGLLCIHGLARLVLLPLCGALAYGWLHLAELIIAQWPNHTWLKPLHPYLPLALPVSLIGVILLWRSLNRSCLTGAALLASFVVWQLQHHQLLQLPWWQIVTVLTLVYLLVVIVDSYFLAYRDDLTGLPSRRALNQQALSLGRNYSVAMLDIDHFKKFNDTYGHDIGDQVLKLVATKLAKVKGRGKVYRYGGEEFTVIFPGKSIEHALPHLESLRQTIADYGIVVRKPERKTKQDRNKHKAEDHKTVSVTISIGVTQRQSKQSFEQALKQADLALYRAKKNGRNNVSQ